MNDQIYTFYRLTSLEKTLLLSENNNEDVTDEYYDKTNVIKITEKYDDRLYRDTSDITASCDENTKNVQFNKLEKTKLNKVNISDLKNKNMIISISIVFSYIYWINCNYSTIYWINCNYSTGKFKGFGF